MAYKKRKKNNRKNKSKGTLTIRAALSAGLIIFALAAANLSFMSYARDALNGAVNNSITFDTVKAIGANGIESLNTVKDRVITVFGETEEKDTDKPGENEAENNNEDEKNEDTVIKILPPESFLPETE